MKNLTALAAALAAGLTTFAAVAQDGRAQVAMLPASPQTAIGTRTKDDLVEKAETNNGILADRGLTTEEIFHRAKTSGKQATDTTEKKPQDRYNPIVEKYALENGVPLELAHAVIIVESNYKPYSLGKAGEVGLMQIKPATAKQMGYDGSTTGLFDPETNIKFGMKYLGKARKLGDGTTCGTILKYNAGHAAKRMNPTSRDYCAKVKRHLAVGFSAGLDSAPEFGRGV